LRRSRILVKKTLRPCAGARLFAVREERLAQALRDRAVAGAGLDLRVLVRVLVRQVGQLPGALAPRRLPARALDLACAGGVGAQPQARRGLAGGRAAAAAGRRRPARRVRATARQGG